MKRSGDAIVVRPARPADTEALVRFRCALWPEGSAAEHRQELEDFFAKAPAESAALVAEGAAGLLGFAELSIRAYAEGCDTDRVGYLEGWFVEADARQGGIGGRLVAAGEAWARSLGCTEFASDTVAENELGATAHRALGFADAGLVRCFRKGL